MYFKPTDNRAKINIPLGYKGTAFSVLKDDPPEAPRPPAPSFKSSATHEIKDTTDKKAGGESITEAKEVSESPDMPADRLCAHLSAPSENGFDAEELLIIALALIVFQGGKENELALLLLALLFIK